jgi:hypothetical protein
MLAGPSFRQGRSIAAGWRGVGTVGFRRGITDVYSTCLFCNSSLGTNDVVEHFPVGRRLAFDPGKGRLWVVCLTCARWNLTPIEERHEAIEECERKYRATFVRTSTENIGLAKLREGLELVRIGEPLRPEFAAWRYAGEFLNRRNRSYLRAGATIGGATLLSGAVGLVAAPVAIAAGGLSIVAMPVLMMAMVGIPVLGKALSDDYMKYERVIARFAYGDGIVNVRAKHARGIELGLFPGGDATLGLQHDGGRVEYRGTKAIHATTVLLANTNRGGASSRAVQAAVDQIEQSKNAAGFLEMASRRNGWRALRPVSVLNNYRGLGEMNLLAVERLALEMSVHEETERRAIQGELKMLEAAWREAEEIAGICDGLLTPPQLGEWLAGRLAT